MILLINASPPLAGILTLASMVVSRLVFQYLGWGVAASVTPAVMGAAGAVFFGATLLGGGAMAGLLPEQAAAAMVGVGSVAGIVTQVRRGFAHASNSIARVILLRRWCTSSLAPNLLPPHPLLTHPCQGVACALKYSLFCLAKGKV